MEEGAGLTSGGVVSCQLLEKTWELLLLVESLSLSPHLLSAEDST